MPRKCIFAVDDDILMGELMTVEIEAAGYDVRAFSSIRVAMERMPAAQPALLILDLNMPEMGGLDVLPALQSNGLLRHTPVLVLSGSTDLDSREKALRLGASAYLVKPVTGAQLRAAVSRVLSIRPAPHQTGTTPESSPNRQSEAAERQINPVVADLTLTYGRSTVARLLNMLSSDLCRLQIEITAGRDAIEQQAHAVKGVAASLGFVAVQTACAELEHACQAGERIETLLRQAAQACASARGEIDNHLCTETVTGGAVLPANIEYALN
jgi:DNA-binding response OmpR family regulator